MDNAMQKSKHFEHGCKRAAARQNTPLRPRANDRARNCRTMMTDQLVKVGVALKRPLLDLFMMGKPPPLLLLPLVAAADLPESRITSKQTFLINNNQLPVQM